MSSRRAARGVIVGIRRDSGYKKSPKMKFSRELGKYCGPPPKFI
jgi:hypothetical protein